MFREGLVLRSCGFVAGCRCIVVRMPLAEKHHENFN